MSVAGLPEWPEAAGTGPQKMPTAILKSEPVFHIWD